MIYISLNPSPRSRFFCFTDTAAPQQIENIKIKNKNVSLELYRNESKFSEMMQTKKTTICSGILACRILLDNLILYLRHFAPRTT
jgi:pyrimidine operon attenuation protein/uracil phosphoribosyltransferase